MSQPYAIEEKVLYRMKVYINTRRSTKRALLRQDKFFTVKINNPVSYKVEVPVTATMYCQQVDTLQD